MHAIDLAGLAGTLTRFSFVQLSLRLATPRSAIQDYWLHTRCRHQLWMERLSQHRDAIARPGTSLRGQRWVEVMPVLQEILLSEPLSRVLAYHATVLEEADIDRECAPLANSSLAAHVEARSRCLHLIVFGAGLPVENAVGLNRLRRLLEKYSDHLLSLMQPVPHPGLFCFEPNRVRKAQRRLGQDCTRSPWIELQATSLAELLWQNVQHQLDWRTGAAQLNHRISQSVLKMMPSAIFSTLGIPHTSHLPSLRQESLDSGPSEQALHPLLGEGQAFRREYTHRLPQPTSSSRLDDLKP